MSKHDRHPNKVGKMKNPDKCGAKTRKPGNERSPGEPGRPCALPAGFGTPHRSGPCHLHGGRGPGPMVAAARKDMEKAAAKELERLNLWGARRDVSPIEALAEELERTAGRVTAIEQRLAQLPEEAQDTPRARGLAAELTAERGQLHRVAEAAARAGVTERRTEVAQDQALQVASLLRSVLGDLELSARQQAAVPALMRWHFAQLNGSAAPGARPPRPSELPASEFFDVEAARRRHEESQSGDPVPAAAPAPPAPDEGRLIELRSVLARRSPSTSSTTSTTPTHDERTT